MGKDFEEDGRGLFQGTIPIFECGIRKTMADLRENLQE
jgi:hypothetical protein